MKFLVAISSVQYSGPTLKVAARIAQAFNAELNIVYVGSSSRAINDSHLDLTRANLSKWNIHHPGLEVLEWAFKELKKICPENDDLKRAEFKADHIKQVDNHFQVLLPTTSGCRVQLTLREGELIQELRDELQSEKYSLTIIGGSQGKQHTAYDLIQFLPSSIFVAQNVSLKKKYKILLLVDDSEATQRSVKFGAEIAKKEKWAVRTLTVSKNKHFGPGYTAAAKKAKAYLEKQDVEVEQFFITGDPVTTFVNFAGDNHIIIMGESTANPIKKFFVGSKPIKTLERSNAPVLIVH